MKTKVLFYCAKEDYKSHLHELYMDYKHPYYQIDNVKGWEIEPEPLNGKIVCECEVECEEIFGRLIYSTDTLSAIELEEKSCLSQEQIFYYLKGKTGYALHISNLKVFDEPLELKMVKSKLDEYTDYGWEIRSLKQAPQNMMNCLYNGEHYVLISIRPEWLCKILNGEKTIEVRKKILKGMM